MRGDKRDFLRHAHFSGATSCFNLPMFPKHPTLDPSSVWHPWIGKTLCVRGVFLPELDGLVKRFSVHGRDIAHEQGAPGTSFPSPDGIRRLTYLPRNCSDTGLSAG
jgi:hypothetical protein